MDAPTLQSAEIMAPSSDAEEGLLSVTAGDAGLAESNDTRAEPTAKTMGSASLSKGHRTAGLKELLPLVAMPPPSEAAVTNRLSKQTYSRLGRNLLFEVRPAVSMHTFVGCLAEGVQGVHTSRMHFFVTFCCIERT